MDLNLFSSDKLPFLNVVILHSRIAWSIHLRWLAVAGFFLATLVSKYVLEILIPYPKIWITLSVLAIINLFYFIVLKIVKKFSFYTELFILNLHIVVDLFALTLLLHFSGGIENPIYLFYIFHVVLSSIIFPRLIPVLFATFVVFLFSGLVYAEYNGLIVHHCIYNGTFHSNKSLIFLVLAVFIITIYVTTYICMTFMHIFRESKRIIDFQNKQLVNADKEKTRFFQYASHELKSPIIAIKSSIDGIVKTFSGSMDQKALNLLERSSARASQMLDIIKELLELSKSRYRSVENEPEDVWLDHLVKSAIAHEAPLANTKEIELKEDIHAENAIVQGYSDDYEKIFNNLINNAIRYTPCLGKVVITTKIEDNCFEFHISDTGIGIAEEDLNNIFAEFYRSKNAKKMVNFGTGLGLSLVKQLVEKNKGKIEVQSEIKKGTTFRVKFPVSQGI